MLRRGYQGSNPMEIVRYKRNAEAVFSWHCIDNRGSSVLRLTQVDLADRMMTEQHVKESIGRSRFKADAISRESSAHLQRFSSKIDLSFLLDFAHDDCGVVLDRRQGFWKRAQTDLITRGRNFQTQGLMRTSK